METLTRMNFSSSRGCVNELMKSHQQTGSLLFKKTNDFWHDLKSRFDLCG